MIMSGMMYTFSIIKKSFVACLILIVATQAASNAPERPRVFLDTSYLPPTGMTIAVPADGDLQAALNSARPGDAITLEAGAVYTGPFTLPKKEGISWIVIRASAVDEKLPPGTRVKPSQASFMPKLQARSQSVVRAALGAHHYRFIGIEFSPMPSTWTWNLIDIGGSRDTSERPHDIIFDRCYIHGDPEKGTVRGVALNGRRISVIDSHVSDFKSTDYDAQALCGWNGSGPFKIVNNYLEASGENINFGGADPAFKGLVPSDIEVRHNHLVKPLSWKIGHPQYQGTPWIIKNLFELKNARRVLIDGNIFERNWGHAQQGFAILFTVRNQEKTAPWSTIRDVTFINNIVRHTGNAIQILGYDHNPCQRMERVLIKNNLFDDVGGPRWNASGIFLLITSEGPAGSAHVVIDHNTCFHTSNIISSEGSANTGFVFTNNILPHNQYGIHGGGVGVGRPAIDKYFPGAVIAKNAIVGGSDFHDVDLSPRTLDDVGFVNRAKGKYGLIDTSPYKGAGTDGEDIGVDWDALQAATAGVVEGKSKTRNNR